MENFAAQADVVCPSGLVGKIRRLRIKELNVLSDPESAKHGTNLDELLKSVWVETIDLGPYVPPFVDFSKGIDWPRVLSGDRLWILLSLRKLTLGSDFFFRVGCPNPFCGHVFNLDINVDELESHGISEEARAAIASGENLIHRKLPVGGSQVGFKLLTGLDDRAINRAVATAGEAVATTAMLVRLPYISGATTPRERRAFVEEMDVFDADWLGEEFEKSDIYVEQSIEEQCPGCGRIHEIRLPLDAGFFSRKSSQRRMKSEE